ncbi:MAG: hypothetical protein IT381_13670 [Deltaproteobacteria bacterium]|nr:hypothetical protein [Deltaproteobacteria bacterium]
MNAPGGTLRGQKGANCITTRDFVRKDVGEARWLRFVETLPPEQETLATRKLSPVEWVDFDHWMALEQRFYDELFGGSYDAYKELTNRIIKHDFNTLYRALIKIGSPAYLIERTAQTYGKFSTVGTMSCVKLVKGPSEADPSIVRLEGVPDLPAIISGIHGAIEGLMELSRAKNPKCWVLKKSGTREAVTVDFAVVY